MARWHRDHNDFVDCKVLEVVTRGKSPRHGTLLIKTGNKKPFEVPAHQVYDWDPADFAPKQNDDAPSGDDTDGDDQQNEDSDQDS